MLVLGAIFLTVGLSGITLLLKYSSVIKRQSAGPLGLVGYLATIYLAVLGQILMMQGHGLEMNSPAKRSLLTFSIAAMIVLLVVAMAALIHYNHIRPQVIKRAAKEALKRTVATGQVWIGSDANPFDRTRISIREIEEDHCSYEFLKSRKHPHHPTEPQGNVNDNYSTPLTYLVDHFRPEHPTPEQLEILRCLSSNRSFIPGS